MNLIAVKNRLINLDQVFEVFDYLPESKGGADAGESENRIRVVSAANHALEFSGEEADLLRHRLRQHSQ
jgi:hypothetical protein